MQQVLSPGLVHHETSRGGWARVFMRVAISSLDQCVEGMRIRSLVHEFIATLSNTFVLTGREGSQLKVTYNSGDFRYNDGSSQVRGMLATRGREDACLQRRHGRRQARG